MRLAVDLLLKNNKIDKDKNKIIMHIIKLLLEKESNGIFKEIYAENANRPKDINFSMYLGRDVKFLRDEIEIPSQKIIVNFSTYDPVIGVSLYNCFLKYKGLEIPIKNNTVLIDKVRIVRPRPITSDKIRFLSKSPIVIREHNNDNSSTFYHSISTKEGKEIFIKNLKYQIKDTFPEIKERDLEEISFEILWNRDVKVKHYGIVVDSNLVEIEIKAKPYILEYLYLDGVGSRKSQGFGYLDLVE
ncbi:CRISPR-associated endoribonuclease Cas6 [Anaerosphaera aminiphila DSM 21120]|uniref:CRISPR-associated endoribonuclease Cas6 n=1 Tax=Anaerosphaera aminiphila DSM 21120 TaxID=1120995 RepID=A0A1M5U5A8_9FIRM|nr:CRISPR-associated endoribonuclease Cas6 [Anaerosphaera aminiphila]SHH58128.1 CRISPR-associated endoribonuclease Cas6 [Anaerosphaera aminiphila DSM 21120]